MQFELTEALIDDILFAMEDQEGEFMLDTMEGIVAGGIEGLDFLYNDPNENDEEDNTRYIELPEWDSASGFRLMERFAVSLRNPIVREELSSALNQGRRVFRAFKNALGRYPEAEKLWFSFKKKEMRYEILRWYNGLREEWGLEKVGTEPEDTDDLLLEDFRFRRFNENDFSQAEVLHRQCFEEFEEKLVKDGAGHSVEDIARQTYTPPVNCNASFGMIAESSGGEFSGYILGIIEDQILYIRNLEVKPEYRGLGVGEALLVRFLESLDTDKTDKVLLDLPFWAEGFSRVLTREAFKPYAVRYWLNLRDRSNT